jgi:hypothetical protein
VYTSLVVTIRLRHAASATGPYKYSFSPSESWEVEDMGIPRVGGDAILLPNGDVVVLNGMQVSCVRLYQLSAVSQLDRFASDSTSCVDVF